MREPSKPLTCLSDYILCNWLTTLPSHRMVANTHAPTHNKFRVQIQDVFAVSRRGEAARFAPFKQLHNRRLLWHGSRTSNFVGILSQGLRIAPPEAPATGYMFGKVSAKKVL